MSKMHDGYHDVVPGASSRVFLSRETSLLSIRYKMSIASPCKNFGHPQSSYPGRWKKYIPIVPLIPQFQRRFPPPLAELPGLKSHSPKEITPHPPDSIILNSTIDGFPPSPKGGRKNASPNQYELECDLPRISPPPSVVLPQSRHFPAPTRAVVFRQLQPGSQKISGQRKSELRSRKISGSFDLLRPRTTARSAFCRSSFQTRPDASENEKLVARLQRTEANHRAPTRKLGRPNGTRPPATCRWTAEGGQGSRRANSEIQSGQC